MARLLRRPLLAVPAALVAVGLAGVGAHAALDGSTAASDNGQSTDTHAIVVNHGDGRYRYAVSLKIVKIDGEVVDPQNAAVAVAANCTDCTTVAISLQGVLVYGDPTVFAPENIALAYNENCSNCQTLAEAYQQIVPVDGKVRITGEGRREIAAVRQDLNTIRTADLTLAEIDARVDADAARLLSVLRNDVVPIGRPAATTDATPAPAASTASTGTTPSDAAPTSSSPAPSSPAPSTGTDPTPTQSTSPTPDPSTTTAG